MVNVAGHMGPAKSRGPIARATLAACTHLSAGVLSLAAGVWLISLAETVLKYMGGWDMYLVLARLAISIVGVMVVLGTRSARPVTRRIVGLAALVGLCIVWFSALVPTLVGAPTDWDVRHWVGVYPWVCGVIALAPALLVLGRFRWRPQSRTAPSVLLVHVALFAACALTTVARPARWSAPDWLPRWATVPRPGAQQCDLAVSLDHGFKCRPTVDVLTLVIVGTIALTFGLAAIVLLTHAVSDGPKGPNLPGAALLLCLAVLTLNTAASVARVSLDWLMTYVNSLTTYVDPQPGWPNPIAFRVLTPYDSPQFIYRPDLVILATVVFGFALWFTVPWATRFMRTEPGREHASPTPPTSGLHALVQSLRFTLAPLLAIALTLFFVGVVGVGVVTDERYTLPGWARLAIVLLVQGAAVLIALLIAGRLAKARDVLERLADVAGFWRVCYHPLAGASYRPHVLRGILHEINRSEAERIVIVGHSQGSVLAACVVNRWEEAGDGRTEKYLHYPHEFRLVTCGSPLSSLYGAFFPAHFDDDFFENTRTRSSQEWVNCWRSSDPIASRVPANVNVWLEDPRTPETVARGHDDYWSDIVQRTVVVGMRTGRSTVEIVSDDVGANFPDMVEFLDEPGPPTAPPPDDRAQ